LRLVLLVATGAGGSHQMASKDKPFVQYACSDPEQVDVVGTWTNPVDLYVCAGSRVNWNDQGHKFLIKFQTSPFEDQESTFDNRHHTSSKMKSFAHFTVFTYSIKVDGHEFDPHVVGGGGLMVNLKPESK
jgi:hypothetical protein